MTIRRDPNGQPMTIGFNGSEHFYLYNAQGDVVAIANYSGEVVVEYTYDAWGNPLSCTGSLASTLGKKNPFRYRGYVYDEETGLYYLNSRYYDPRVGRFICADAEEILADNDDLIHCNLFAYCTNDPVNFFDDDGYWKLPNWAKIAIGATAIVGLAVATAVTGGAAGVICGAALSGALTGAAVGSVSGAVVGGITSGWQGAWNGMSDGFMSGAISGGVVGGALAGGNILSGLKIVGKPHGTVPHKLSSNLQAGKMATSGNYSKIALNRSLKTQGLNGSSRPDVIGVARIGKDKIVEVVSLKQPIESVMKKVTKMVAANPNSVGSVIKWVRYVGQIVSTISKYFK